MNKKNTILIIIVAVTLVTVIGIATYAYFATGILNVSNVANLNVVTERNNMVFDTLGGEMTLNVTAANMAESLSGNVAAENNTTLTVNLTANTDYSMVCTYDIVYEWTSSDKYTAHTSGVSSNEFTIQGTLASNAHVSEGTNSINGEKDLSTFTYTSNSTTVVSGAQIDGTGNTMSTAVWTLTSKFYNVDGDQSALSGKTYTGRFKVANVSCTAGTVTASGPTSYWYPTTLSTWNDSTGQMEPLYTHPNYGGTVQSTGTATGHNVYIGQDSSKYYVCINDSNGHEVCLSQPYTQYGLSGHTYCNDDSCLLTSEQQTSAKQAIYQAFIDAGITLDINNDCYAFSDDVGCGVGGLYFGVNIYGTVYCSDYSENVGCAVDTSGHANCA